VSRQWDATNVSETAPRGDAALQQLQLAHLARSVCLSVAAVWALLQVARRRD
jgi:hypothetical protein